MTEKADHSCFARRDDRERLIIRSLALTDLTTLEALAAAAEREGFRFPRRFAHDLRATAVSLDAAREFFLGAVLDDRIVAVGGVTPDPYVDDPATGRIRHLYVAADFRRKGVGAALMRALEARACQQYDRLRLRTDTVDAAAFYERLGYLSIDDETATHERRCPRVSRSV
jgi:GNAT superfamily N-acetyltransferase